MYLREKRVIFEKLKKSTQYCRLLSKKGRGGGTNGLQQQFFEDVEEC